MQPESVAVDLATNRIYVANSSSGTVSVIDGSTNTLITTIPVGSATFDNPEHIAVNPVTNRIYASNSRDGTVAVIDGASDTVIMTIPGISNADGIEVNPLTNKVYVTDESDNKVFVIDGVTNAIISSVAVANGPENIAVNPLTNKIYVSTEFSDIVAVIDGSTDTLKTTITVPGITPDGITVNPVTNLVYVSAADGRTTIDVIDGSSDTLSTSFTVPAGTDSVAVNVITNQLVAGSDEILASLVDLNTNTVIASLTAPRADELDAVAANPLTNTFYVADENSNFLAVFVAGAPATQAQISGLPCLLRQALGIQVSCQQNIVLSGLPVVPQTAPTKTCTATAPAAGGTTACTLTLTAPLGATSYLTDSLLTPAGATISSCTATGGLVCQPGTPSGSVQVNCPGPSAYAIGSTFSLVIGSSVAGALNELVTITPAGRLGQSFPVTPSPAVNFGGSGTAATSAPSLTPLAATGFCAATTSGNGFCTTAISASPPVVVPVSTSTSPAASTSPVAPTRLAPGP